MSLINENFAPPDPNTRGWLKKGSNIDWDSTPQRAGGRFYFNIAGNPNSYVKPITYRTDAEGFTFETKITFHSYGISWANSGFGLFNSANTRRKNSICISGTRLNPTTTSDHGLIMLAYDNAGNAISSPFVPGVVFARLGGEQSVNATMTYNVITRKITLQVYTLVGALIGSSELTLPPSFPITMNECGARTQDHTLTTQWCQYYMDDVELTASLPPIIYDPTGIAYDTGEDYDSETYDTIDYAIWT